MHWQPASQARERLSQSPVALLADGCSTTVKERRTFGGSQEPLARGTTATAGEQDTLLLACSQEDHVSGAG